MMISDDAVAMLMLKTKGGASVWHSIDNYQLHMLVTALHSPARSRVASWGSLSGAASVGTEAVIKHEAIFVVIRTKSWVYS